MFGKAKEGVTEEDYYLSEWTAEERSQVGWLVVVVLDVECCWIMQKA